MVQIWGHVPDISETVARIDAVSRSDVLEVARAHAVESPAALALYGPVDAAPSLDVIANRRAA
jgi:hypothetical protein